MKHLRILIILFVICSSAFIFLSFTYKKSDNFSFYNLEKSHYLDTIKTEEGLISIDSIESVPGKELINTKDTSTNTRPESEILINDSIGLIKPEIISPTDSLYLIEEKFPSDSIFIIQKDIKDTIRRIEFRSVYADSIEQGNPNFMPKKILEIKWITEKRDTAIRFKNIIGFDLFYGVYTYGFGFGIFKRLSNDADFVANINLSYVFDRRSKEDIDTNNNMSALDKVSRLYPIVFNVGLEKYFMQNRTDWKVKPILIFGFAPALIPVTPYELTFFKSLKKLKLAYGLGVYAALGFDWQALKRFGFNLTARYSFIPIVINRDIYYYRGFLVKNIGGFYIDLGFTLLQEYYGKK